MENLLKVIIAASLLFTANCSSDKIQSNYSYSKLASHNNDSNSLKAQFIPQNNHKNNMACFTQVPYQLAFMDKDRRYPLNAYDVGSAQEINFWDKTVIIIDPALVFRAGTDNFSMSAEKILADVFKIIQKHPNTESISVISHFPSQTSTRSEVIASIIWDIAGFNKNRISFSNDPNNGFFGKQYMEIVLI